MTSRLSIPLLLAVLVAATHAPAQQPTTAQRAHTAALVPAAANKAPMQMRRFEQSAHVQRGG
jgi:hypothetical protein